MAHCAAASDDSTPLLSAQIGAIFSFNVANKIMNFVLDLNCHVWAKLIYDVI